MNTFSSHRRASSSSDTDFVELCHAVFEESPAMLWMGNELGECVFLNKVQRDFWGLETADLSQFNWAATLHPEDIEKLSAPFAKAMEEQIPFTVQARYRRADGSYRTLRTEARPRFDTAGTFLGMTGVNFDITDQLVAEERTRYLLGELNHRTKNILAVVQAVVRQTIKNSDPKELETILKARLASLASSNDLLVKSDWGRVSLKNVIVSQLGHLQEFLEDRIQITGPELLMSAQAAQTLGMAFHELSTNSLKYGALGRENGKVTITWDYDPGSEELEIQWSESGAKTAGAPKSKGFGHAVTVDMVKSTLEADVDVRFERDGFKWSVLARSGVEQDGV